MKTSSPPIGISAVMSYDPDTGLFHWLVRTRAHGGWRFPGDVAGTSKDGYITIFFGGVQYRAHRVAWYIMAGDWLPATQDIDHVNRDRSDNRWANLRLLTRSKNNLNSETAPRGTTGVRGVHWVKRKSKWQARIKHDGVLHQLGTFPEFAEAVAARRAAELRLTGHNATSTALKAPLTPPSLRATRGLTAEGIARRNDGVRQARQAKAGDRRIGVRRNPTGDRWLAMIGVAGKTIYLGTFDEYVDAVAAREAAELTYKSLGDPPCPTSSSPVRSH